MRAALIQMPVTADKSENLETACLRLREAKARGADIAVLPEMFCWPCPPWRRSWRCTW